MNFVLQHYSHSIVVVFFVVLPFLALILSVTPLLSLLLKRIFDCVVVLVRFLIPFDIVLTGNGLDLLP